MSHAPGVVKFTPVSRVIGHFEYDGTSDVALPRIFNTREEMHAQWRRQEPVRRCNCDDTDEVTLVADYGGGIEWQATVCLRHNLIVDRRSPTDGRGDGDGWMP